MLSLSQTSELADRATNTLLLTMGLVSAFFVLLVIISTALNYKRIARKLLNKKISEKTLGKQKELK